MNMCAIEVDKNENIRVRMLLRTQKRLIKHLKRRTEKMVTYVTVSLTFTSMVKTSVY